MNQSQYVQRVQSRYNLESPIRFAKQNMERLLPARMLNISDNGMCFESRYDINPHSDVCIWLEQKIRISDKGIKIYNFYRSKVLWCREINSGTALGIGVQHVNKTQCALVPEFVCSVCEEKISMGNVHFVKDFVYLCSKCYQNMQSCSENSREQILRILEGNVF
jgi:hypothetical protein